MKIILVAAALVLLVLPLASAFELVGANLPDSTYRGYDFATHVTLASDIPDWHATVVIPELGIVERSRDLDETRNANVFMSLPYNIMPGEYLVRVQVVQQHGDEPPERHFVHRWMYVE